MLRDPVCGKRLTRNHAHIAFDYQGVTYYLCCPRCQADFESAPEKFARPAYGEKTKLKHPNDKLNRNHDDLGGQLTIVRGPVQ